MNDRNCFAVSLFFDELRMTHACSIGGYSAAGISAKRPLPFIFGDKASDNATMPTSAAPETTNDAVCEMFSPQHKLVFHFVVDVFVLHRCDSSLPVGGVLWVSDGDLFDGRVHQSLQARTQVEF